MKEEEYGKTGLMLIFGFIALGLIIWFTFAVLGLGWQRVAEPIREETRRVTYDESRAYQQGTQLELARLCREWQRAEGPAKTAVATIIRDTRTTYRGPVSEGVASCLAQVGE